MSAAADSPSLIGYCPEDKDINKTKINVLGIDYLISFPKEKINTLCEFSFLEIFSLAFFKHVGSTNCLFHSRPSLSSCVNAVTVALHYIRGCKKCELKLDIALKYRIIIPRTVFLGGY